MGNERQIDLVNVLIISQTYDRIIQMVGLEFRQIRHVCIARMTNAVAENIALSEKIAHSTVYLHLSDC